MTEPKRWSSPGSDVDPVLRAVLRYARDLEPTSEQLGALVEGVAEHRSLTPRRSRRALWSIAAVAAVFMSGAALAAYAVSVRQAPVLPAPSASPAAPVPQNPGGAHAPRPAVASTPVQPEPSTAPVVKATPSAASRVPQAWPSSSTADVEKDARLLQEARSAVATNPARALTLTRDHELHFPTSALTEERQALRIEALARLGRRAEAERELQAFAARFPRSIYTRRLQALTSPQSSQLTPLGE